MPPRRRRREDEETRHSNETRADRNEEYRNRRRQRQMQRADARRLARLALVRLQRMGTVAPDVQMEDLTDPEIVNLAESMIQTIERDANRIFVAEQPPVEAQQLEEWRAAINEAAREPLPEGNLIEPPLVQFVRNPEDPQFQTWARAMRQAWDDIVHQERVLRAVARPMDVEDQKEDVMEGLDPSPAQLVGWALERSIAPPSPRDFRERMGDIEEAPPQPEPTPMVDIAPGYLGEYVQNTMNTDQLERAVRTLQRRARGIRRIREGAEMEELNRRLEAVALAVDDIPNFRDEVTRITRILEFARPADVVRGMKRLDEIETELSRRFTEAQEQGTQGLAARYNEQYGWLTEELERFRENIRQKYPQLVEGNGIETEAQFVRRYERMEAELRRAFNRGNVDETERLTARVEQEQPRYTQIQRAVLGQDITPYMERVVSESTNAIVLPEDAPMFKLIKSEYDGLRKDLEKIYKAIERERLKEEPSIAKLTELKEQWNDTTRQLEERRPYFIQARDAFEQKRAEERDAFVKEMQTNITRGFDELAMILFQPYQVGATYIPLENLPQLVENFMKMRKVLLKYYEKEFDIDQPNWEDEAMLRSGIENMKEYIYKEFRRLEKEGKGTRDPNEIMKDMQTKEKLLGKVILQSGEGGLEIPKFEKSLLVELDTSKKELQLEHVTQQTYEVLTKDFPLDWNDAVQSLEADITDLRRRVTQDISSFGPILSTVVDQIWNRFVQRIQNVSATEREQFKNAIDAEKKHLYDTISQETSYRLGLDFQNRDKEVVDFLYDPTTFAQQHQEGQQVLGNTTLGSYMGTTRRLMDLLRRGMELRQRMIYEPYRLMGTEGAFDATKFDLILTHLYPPSQLELKLRYLMTLPDKDRYKNSPFLLAIRQLDPDFDIRSLTYENFLQRSSELGDTARSFLQQKVGMTSIAWGDFEHMSDELTRVMTTLLTQTAPPVDDTAVERGMEGFGPRAPPSEGMRDQDAGALMNSAGYRINPTFNPTTAGQITRDKIDEAKLQSYLQIVGPVTTVLLGVGEEDSTYVPMHPGAAKFYFSFENYDALKSQYERMKPLVPKKPLKDPNGIIEQTLAEYGEVLGIRKRKSRPTDHPVFVQKEAIELQELVQAYKNYTSRSAGNFQHVPEEGGGSAPPPAQAPQEDVSPQPEDADDAPLPKRKRDNPNDTGESRTEPIMRGLRSAYLDNMETNLHEPFSNPFQ